MALFRKWPDPAGLITLLLVGSMILVGCNGGDTPGLPPPSGGGEQPPPASPRPDLTISAIQVSPAQPQAGQHFSVNVYVKNAGQAPSGDYDLAIYILDVSRGSKYPVGTFRNEGLQPGDDVAAYASTDQLVNFAGSHQVHVEIIPFNFEHGNTHKNETAWAFTVK
jgi:hypothetical protein